MKKISCLVLAAGVFAAAFSFASCGGTEEKTYSVYCPDGAPALSLVNAIEAGDKAFDFHVIASATIQAQVTGESPAADFCVLPLNLASKLLGTGENYKLLGTVTNGNIYFLSLEGSPALQADTLGTSLLGKTLGAVQLENVPGLTLQAVLKDRGVPYRIIENKDAEKAADKVNLLNLGTDATNVTPAFGCDYYLCPEPAATAKVLGTKNAPKPLVRAGDLQALYGDGTGYPQAVLVAKNSVLQSDKAAVNKLVKYFSESGEYLKKVEPNTVLTALAKARTNGLAPAFNEKNLNAEVIQNCSVSYTEAKNCKAAVNAFLTKLIAVNANSAKTVSDEFFYLA